MPIYLTIKAILPNTTLKSIILKLITSSFTEYPALKKKNGAKNPKTMAFSYFSISILFLKNSEKNIPTANAKTASFIWISLDKNPRDISMAIIKRT